MELECNKLNLKKNTSVLISFNKKHFVVVDNLVCFSQHFVTLKKEVDNKYTKYAQSFKQQKDLKTAATTTKKHSLDNKKTVFIPYCLLM